MDCKCRDTYWFAKLIQTEKSVIRMVSMFHKTNQSKNFADCKRDRFEIKSPFCILWTGPRRISSTQSSWLSLKQTTLLTFLKIQTRRYNRSNHDLPWIKILYNLAICMRIKILSYSYNAQITFQMLQILM